MLTAAHDDPKKSMWIASKERHLEFAHDKAVKPWRARKPLVLTDGLFPLYFVPKNVYLTFPDWIINAHQMHKYLMDLYFPVWAVSMQYSSFLQIFS